MLGAIDCADMANQKICSDFGIIGYPTVKFFEAFSKKPNDGISLRHGDDIQDLRESIITSLEKSEMGWPPACPPLEPISAVELYSFFQTNNVTYLALIFEKKDSFLGREVTLDMLQFENIAVRRVLKSNEVLVNSFSITAFPSGCLLVHNGSCHPIPAHVQTRALYTDYLRNLSGVIRGHFFIPTESPTEGPMTTTVPWRTIDRRKVYMADVESAVSYSLRVEVARYLRLDEDNLFALKQYVGVLVKYFPGRYKVMNYLRHLNWWLQPMTNVSQSEWEEALRNTTELPNAWLPETPTWVGCQGSQPKYRGFPCGLWTLFHLLTVQEALRNPKHATPSEVLPTMRTYVKYFFGCRECARHFEAMAAESINTVKNKDGAILWLWSRHNRVNARLAGDSSDDPAFPKIPWPPRDMCFPCWLQVNGISMWDQRAVLRFFKVHFSKLDTDYMWGNRTRYGRDVENRDFQIEGNLEREGRENIQEVEEEFEGNKKRREKLENARLERSVLERAGSQDLHRPSIVKMNTKTKELEEDIVDLDTFSEQHYRNKALKVAGQANNRLQRNRREIGMVKMKDLDLQAFDYDAAWERLRQKELEAQQISYAMKEGEKENELSLRRNQWFRVLGVGFSQLDVSLCIVLYFLSSMSLLGMYTFFRMHMRYRKSRQGYPSV